ncbi:hypothetical protein PoB_000190000 [Plakobranchus ocellatus]|uniref:Uncharacterized protein n=1 Tax=Plakobranchus ocellatus TaxID=259542 RepID=A0AAV3XX72_9GAST|nr:hypothetical protein PoB_000190000 [Plakobranchus ocellatus]
MACPQQGDPRFDFQALQGRARTRDRRVPADLRADSLSSDAPEKLEIVNLALPKKDSLAIVRHLVLALDMCSQSFDKGYTPQGRVT